MLDFVMTPKILIMAVFFLMICTAMESLGDSIIRRALGESTNLHRFLMFCCAGVLLFLYGLFLNLAPIDFNKVVGLYIAVLFMVWQITSYIVFGSTPNIQTLVCGGLIVVGGVLFTFWK